MSQHSQLLSTVVQWSNLLVHVSMYESVHLFLIINLASTMIIELTPEHGKCVAVLVLLWIQQQLVFAVMVAVARKKSGIQPPTLYPRDSEIKNLNLSPADVDSYMCAQRVHQNNVEFLSCYFPVMILAMLDHPTEVFYASVVVLVGRMVTAVGYYQGAVKRVFGGFFHFGEYYVVYLAGRFAYKLIASATNGD